MPSIDKILIIAHRGVSIYHPGNTLKAFTKAIELKADYIEFDVHQTKDGEIVVIHDAYITNNQIVKRYIKQMELKELKTIDIGEGETIPTLKELIKIAKGNIGLQCEVKATNFSKQLIELLEQENLIKSSIISSFMFNELLELQKLNSESKLALLIPPDIHSDRRLMKYCQKAIDAEFYAIHPYFKLINNELVKKMHQNDLLVNVWTVNKESDIRDVIQMDIDGIITDDVELVKEVLNKK